MKTRNFLIIAHRIMTGENSLPPSMMAEAMEGTETVEEGFQVVHGRKRKRISSASSFAEISRVRRRSSSRSRQQQTHRQRLVDPKSTPNPIPNPNPTAPFR